MRALLLTLTVCLCTLPANAKYSGGTGEPNDPYQIATAADLNAIGTEPNDWDKHFVVMADIDLKGLRGAPFNMIGVNASYGRPFSGVFNGNGKTISNLTCNKAGATSWGLFAAVQGADALIKNLRLKGATVNAGTAGIAGALVGYLHSGKVSRCHADGGSVSGTWAVGGLVGICNGTIINCSSSATVSVSDMTGGGLVGQNTGTVTQCYSTGPVSARSFSGGLVGDSGGTVSDCYSTAKATAGKGYAGGLVASNSGKIRNCYSTGAVSAPQGAGGLVGGTKGQQGVTSSFWDTESSVQSTSAGGSGRRSGQLRTAATFAGWDFRNTWTIQERVDYPRLQWEADPFPTLVPTSIEKASGDNQSGWVGSKAGSPLTVRVKDQEGEPMAGAQVEFTVIAGGSTVEPASVVTNAGGVASTELTLGPTAGRTQVRATVGSLSVDFSIEALPLPVATTLEKVSGDNQQAVAGSKVALPLVIRVKDQYGQVMANIQVAFFVTAGDGAIEPASGTTDASGVASALLTLGPTTGPVQVRASVGSLSVDFSIEALPLPVATTLEKVSGDNQNAPAGSRTALPLTVRVKDQYGQVMANIQVAFLVIAGDGTVEPASAVTNADGLASVIATVGPTEGLTQVKATVGTLSVDFNLKVMASAYTEGTGEPNDPYRIRTPEQMNALGAEPYNWGKHFKLMADIDLAAYDGKEGRPAFNTIGSFAGVFDGNDHTISHLTITNRSFFGTLGASAEVKNLRVVDVNVAGSGYGIVMGIGGLVGQNNGTLTRCYSSGAVRGTQYVGGLVGYNSWRGLVYQCHSSCVVSGTQTGVGGLVGCNGATVTQCYSTGAVSGDYYHVGGLVGDNTGGIVTESYSTATVSGGIEVGGLVGFTGGTVTHCYSIGPVTAGQTIGGLVGWWFAGMWGTVTASFWDIQTSGLATSPGGTGRTTAQMQTAKTFLQAGWDFVDETTNGTEDIWRIAEGVGYPHLSWEKYSGGAGEPNDPYQITTAADLIALGETPADYDKHFLLTADIDLDPNLPGGKVFDKAVIAPDANDAPRWEFDGTPFSSIFDGNGHTVFHLTMKGGDWLGLFGWLGLEAEVKNLGLVDVKITGSGYYVGGLAGCNRGMLTHCYSTGTVSSNSEVGGLVGGNYDGTVSQCYSTGAVSSSSGSVGGLVGFSSYGTVSACYSTGAVSGNAWVGGLVGGNEAGPVTQCYSTGVVSGTDFVGGLVGGNCPSINDVSINNCFWDIETSGQATSAGGVGKTTGEMRMASTFLDAGWDFVGETANGTEDIWWIDEGKDYPRLWWEAAKAAPLKYGGGAGEPNDPYLIATAEQMNAIGVNPADWDKHFKLVADIDLSAYAGRFNMIGTGAEDNFTGVFDGNGHTISHLTISGGDYLGLFCRVRSPAEIKNLGLLDIDVTGIGYYVSYVGGLVGSNGDSWGARGGVITDCYSTGTVSGAGGQANYFGGLVGSSYGEISRCYSTAAVTGAWHVGGLVGGNGQFTFTQGTVKCCYSIGTVRANVSGVGGLVGKNYGAVADCYSVGAVSGGLQSAPWAGGLLGSNSGTVTNCYSTGAVSGTGWYVGGFTCWSMGTVAGCFWDTQTSGQTTSDGGTGKTTAEMQMAKTFLDTGWDFVGETVNGSEDIWKIAEGLGYPRLWWEARD